MIKMWHKDYREDIDVYEINIETKFATCYVPSLAGRQGGNGWAKIKISKLIPYPHAEVYKNNVLKPEYDKIKSMLTISYAEWACTDGSVFTHDKLIEAIEHQKSLMEGE